MNSNMNGYTFFQLKEADPFLSRDVIDLVHAFEKMVNNISRASPAEIETMYNRYQKLEPKFHQQLGRALLTKMGYHAFAS